MLTNFLPSMSLLSRDCERLNVSNLSVLSRPIAPSVLSEGTHHLEPVVQLREYMKSVVHRPLVLLVRQQSTLSDRKNMKSPLQGQPR
jgi:hypothetical protein